MKPVAPLVLLVIFAALFGCSKEKRNTAHTPAVDVDAVRRQFDQPGTTVSDEAQTRKQRSIALLKQEGVPFIEHLPAIAAEADPTRRTTEQVAARALALCVVGFKADGVDQASINELIEAYELEQVFSPQERAFVENPDPSQKDRNRLGWRIESYWIMLWALGMVDELERPDGICDVDRAMGLMLDNNDRDGFVAQAKLRPQSELLDAADLIYRYHWAAVDARLNGQKPTTGLNSQVIRERHYALNWLIGYMDQDWDDISTDT